MKMKSVFWWRKPEYPEETTDQGGDMMMKSVAGSRPVPQKSYVYISETHGTRWLRLPFGIRSAPEIYQRVTDRHHARGYRPSRWCDCHHIHYKFIVAGRTIEEHDEILKSRECSTEQHSQQNGMSS